MASEIKNTDQRDESRNCVFNSISEMPEDALCYRPLPDGRFLAWRFNIKHFMRDLLVYFLYMLAGIVIMTVMFVCMNAFMPNPYESIIDDDDDNVIDVEFHSDKWTHRSDIVDVRQLRCLSGCGKKHNPIAGFKKAECSLVKSEDSDDRTWYCDFPPHSYKGICVDSYNVVCEYHLGTEEFSSDYLSKACALQYTMKKSNDCVDVERGNQFF
ncbi:MAG: hypothetical protein JSS82_03590 [Bacteroidetes bacterium]|nr:hypothetical protein [Bacteroidota bacterium]